METIDLYKFVTKNEVEYHYYKHIDDVIMFVNLYEIEEFNKLLGSNILDDGGIECHMKEGYFCFMMKDICEHFGIDMFDIFENLED